MCRWCGEFEAGMFAGGSDEFCSVDCIDSFDSTSSCNEPAGSYDLSDDADALASAGWGSDEDYGGGCDGW